MKKLLSRCTGVFDVVIARVKHTYVWFMGSSSLILMLLTTALWARVLIPLQIRFIQTTSNNNDKMNHLTTSTSGLRGKHHHHYKAIMLLIVFFSKPLFPPVACLAYFPQREMPPAISHQWGANVQTVFVRADAVVFAISAADDVPRSNMLFLSLDPLTLTLNFWWGYISRRFRMF